MSFLPLVSLLPMFFSRREANLKVYFFSLAGFALGIASLTVSLAVVAGFERSLFQSISQVSGHFVVRLSQLSSKELPEWQKKLQRVDPSIRLFPMLSGESLAVHRGKSVMVGLYSLCCHTDQDWPQSWDFLRDLANHPGQLIVGTALAERLSLQAGDELTLVRPKLATGSSQGVHRQVSHFRVWRVLDFGKHEYNERLVFMNYQDLHVWLEVPYDSGFVGFMSSPELALQHKTEIKKHLPQTAQLQTWYDLNSYLFEAIGIERYVIFFVIFLIVVAAAFNMSISLWVSLVRKTKEMSLLKVLGLRPLQSVVMMFFVALSLALVAISVGIPLGVGVSYLIDRLIVDWNLLPADVYKIGHIETRIRGVDLGLIMVSVLALAVLVAWPPARSIRRMRIAEGLRFE
ncbi:MAG: FtsX-like permease family protein [Bdellovibrionaceae bacterium]|nr:FtsX-like permease family protein [Pseudobdellovibrionaceae bacterium]